MNKSLLIYLPEEFADWEGSFLLPELANNKIPYVIASESGKPVSSIGRLKVTPDAALSDVATKDIAGLVMIGSDTWADSSKNQKVLSLAAELLNKNVLVAAICAATVALAREGHLEKRKHTSNDLGMLKAMVPTYTGEQHYSTELAVRDGNLITASGVGALEFTLELMKEFGIYSDEKRQQWFELYKRGTPPPLSFWS